jgi:hypothetical protein
LDSILSYNVLSPLLFKNYFEERDVEDDIIHPPNIALPLPSFSAMDILSHKIKIFLKYGNVNAAKAINQMAHTKFKNRG